jgi:hypothetical protein
MQQCRRRQQGAFRKALAVFKYLNTASAFRKALAVFKYLVG